MLKRNRKTRQEDIVYTILTSWLFDHSWCPTTNSIKLSKEIIPNLIHTAQNNKLVVLLHHLTECISCEVLLLKKHKDEIEKLYRATLAITLAVEKAEEKLIKLFRDRRINFCLVKNWSLYPKIYKNFPRTRTDIDILISPKDKEKVLDLFKKRGYRKYDQVKFTTSDTKRVYYEEYVVRHKETFVKVDLRFLAAMPDAERFALFLPKNVRKLSSKMLKYDSTVEKPLPVELFLLTQIMHFFSNDLMRGLRHLYEIVFLAKLYQDKINWRRFDRLARMYNARLVAMFVFSFAKDLFGFNFAYPGALPTINERLSVKLARLLIAPQQIVFFPLEVWSDEVIWRENMLLRLFLQPKPLFYKIYQLKESDARAVFLEKVFPSL